MSTLVVDTVKPETLTGQSTTGSIGVTGEGNSTTTNLQRKGWQGLGGHKSRSRFIWR